MVKQIHISPSCCPERMFFKNSIKMFVAVSVCILSRNNAFQH